MHIYDGYVDVVRTAPPPLDMKMAANNIEAKHAAKGNGNRRMNQNKDRRGRDSRSHNMNNPRYPDGCQCYNTCDEYGNYQCGIKCSCEFWYDSEQKAIEHSHDMMVKNAYFRDRYSFHGRAHRPGNDYFGREPLEIEGNVNLMNQKINDRRDQSAGDPFKKVISGQRSDSWDRFEDDECHYVLCRDHQNKNCAWFYDFFHCGEDRNNNGRYFDEYFARARMDFSFVGDKTGKHNDYGNGKLSRTRQYR